MTGTSKVGFLGTAMVVAALVGCAPAATTSPAATPAPAAGGAAGAGEAGDTSRARAGGTPQVRPYARVITSEAQTERGLFITHRIGDKVFFEIPRRELGQEQAVMIRTAAGGASGGFFGGGQTRFVRWDLEGNRVFLREQSYDFTAEPGTAIERAVVAMRAGPILQSFNVESWGPDGAPVIDVSRLFTTNVARFAGVNQLQGDRSFLESVRTFDEVVNVGAWQTGTATPTPGPGAPPAGQASQQPPVTALVHYSFRKLPEQPMQPRLWDPRIGMGSVRFVDYSRADHRAEERRYIRRYRLEKQNPSAEISEPVQPIVFWIDPATPEWLVPWVEAGVHEWLPAYEEAGFRNAIQARMAPTPEQDDRFSLFDARHSVIYWRPSPVANATGGQQVDPRTGEILKAEVNMYHNVMNLLRNWYFTQVSPLDPRAQVLPLPDSLMGRLVQYVVAHEIGHAIGFPHNMKASAMFPADSIRSESFLRRKGSHVSTLMDYSRFNYVAQPEDNIPPELLIPGVGPYDRFAIMYQNRPIPGATTPDEERAVLNSWASMQDTIPWFRFSTEDATQDPYDLTEAVGDEDAVKSTTLGMRNLERVANSLLRVAERPGEDYSLLSELYGNTVQQWGRYSSHVAAIVGGAETQERLGTGVRFTPISRAKQQEAMRYLNQNAFQVPQFLLNRDVLRRIEQEGAVARIRGAQANVLNTLLARGRLDRVIEYEALAMRPADAYTLANMLSDLRQGVWAELGSSSPRVDVYRRNLQRAYLEAVERTLDPPPPTTQQAGGPGAAQQPRWANDARPILRGELQELDRLTQRAIGRTADPMTRLH
ncbi:MAG: zinc-dependent metalloprotease, partial [Gemmatimonadetes bacterium]|nr:zinc-dependent metalloprotease [Gemmatimonadota bacterium]